LDVNNESVDDDHYAGFSCGWLQLRRPDEHPRRMSRRESSSWACNSDACGLPRADSAGSRHTLALAAEPTRTSSRQRQH
jgi:hypothetical protein